MKQYFNSIRFRIWISFVLFSLLTVWLFYIAQSVFTPKFYGQLKTQECISAAGTISDTISDEKWNFNVYEDIEKLNVMVRDMARENRYDIVISFPSMGINLVTSRSGNSGMLEDNTISELVQELLSDQKKMIINNVNGETDGIVLATYVAKNDNIAAYIFIYSYVEPIGTTLRIVNTISFVFANVILIIACVISIIISSHIANPLVKISRSANQLITGNFSMKIRKNEFEEIATLTENLNEASKEIARTETLRRDLMANVSHDLRTPLTMIKAYAEMIRDLSGSNPEKREKHLQVIIDEADRLALLVSDMLNLSKLDSGISKMNLTTFDFSEHLNGLVSRFSMLDDTNDYQVVAEVEDNIFITADQQKIEQVVYNLINNAINYIGDDKMVVVRLFTKENSTARFEVADKGVGIPEDQIPYIWDRYYKIDHSENYKRAVKGTGLGLSIVKGILTNHKFKFGCDSKVNEGSCFWFEFEKQKETIAD